MSIEQRSFAGMGGHQSASMVRDEWLTPPHILKALGAPDIFDLDPCAPIVRPWPIAREHYTIADNGLMKPWRGLVFMNSPYGGPDIVGPWMRRLVDHGDGIGLIFARTETELFFETVWRAADAVLFIEGRLFFHVAVASEFKRKGAPSIFVEPGGRAPANGGRAVGACGVWASVRRNSEKLRDWWPISERVALMRKPRPKRLTAPGVIGRKLYLGEWLLAGLCAARGIGVRDVRSDSRENHIAAVRREFCIIAKQFNIGVVLVGRLIHRGHATVPYHQSVVYRTRKLDQQKCARRKTPNDRKIIRGIGGRFACREAGGGLGGHQGAGGAGTL